MSGRGGAGDKWKKWTKTRARSDEGSGERGRRAGGLARERDATVKPRKKTKAGAAFRAEQ